MQLCCEGMEYVHDFRVRENLPEVFLKILDMRLEGNM
jgi:hypothetical protein